MNASPKAQRRPVVKTETGTAIFLLLWRLAPSLNSSSRYWYEFLWNNVLRVVEKSQCNPTYPTSPACSQEVIFSCCEDMKCEMKRMLAKRAANP
jgi:hypothetical protein